MRGRFTTSPEIAGCADQTRSELMLPNAIDDDPGGQRVFWAGDRLGQFQSAAAASERLAAIDVGENLWKSTWHAVAPIAHLATTKDHRIVEFRLIDHHHAAWWCPGVRHRNPLYVADQLVVLVPLGLVQMSDHLVNIKCCGGVTGKQQLTQRFVIFV